MVYLVDINKLWKRVFTNIVECESWHFVCFKGYKLALQAIVSSCEFQFTKLKQICVFCLHGMVKIFSIKDKSITKINNCSHWATAKNLSHSCVIRRKLCTGRQAIVNRVVARKATDWSKFCKRCETGNSIGLYSVCECGRNVS